MNLDDRDLLIDENEDKLEEITQATEQHEAMQAGEIVDPHPGEPASHRYAHAVELMMLNETVMSQDFMLMQQVQMPELQQFVSMILAYKNALAEHLRKDSILSGSAGEAALAETDAISQAMSPQPEMPRNNAPNVPLAGGGMGLPNEGGIPVPSKEGPEDVQGQIGAGMV